MPCEFYHPMKTWYPTYVTPFYCRDGRYASAEDWRALCRLVTFNFLFHNTVLEPPTAPVPPSKIGPPRKVSELRVLDGLDTEYLMPTTVPIQIWVMKRLDIYNLFKANLVEQHNQQQPKEKQFQQKQEYDTKEPNQITASATSTTMTMGGNTLLQQLWQSMQQQFTTLSEQAPFLFHINENDHDTKQQQQLKLLTDHTNFLQQQQYHNQKLLLHHTTSTGPGQGGQQTEDS
jgi:hypothetical protein